MPYPIITTAPALSRFADELAEERVIAVDLEADSMHNYREKVCLLQFSTTARTVLVDPLAVRDLSCLQRVFADRSIRKIFHAADYDIRSLYRDFQIEVCGLFDTMICCQFLGEEQVGLAAVLAKYFDVRLEKRYQRADWSRRPLPEGMVAYAGADTTHLHQLAAQLEGQIKQKNRQDWVAEECTILEKVRHSVTKGPLFLKVKGAGRLNGRQLAALEGLLQWRDEEARRLDRPLYKVIGTKELLVLAQQTPLSLSDVKRLPLPARLVEKNGRCWLGLIEQAQALPSEQLPVFPPKKHYAEDAATRKRLKALKKWRTGKAAELNVDPGILINGALLEEISRHPPVGEGALAGFSSMKKWQRCELGRDIVEVVNN